MRRSLLSLAALLAFCLPVLAQTVGRIDLVAGGVTVVDAKAKGRSIKVGDPIQQGDTVTTAKDGELHMSFEDGSVIAVRPEAKMQVVRFQSAGRDSDGSVVALIRGALRAISGLIGHRNPQNVLLQTPTATIGIRGTDHEAMVIPADSDLGEPGTYDKVNSGGTRIQSERGSVDVAPGQAGYASATAAPALLPAIPEFFKPTTNEKRLEGLDGAQRAGERAAAQKSGKGGVQIQGNTRINASATNVNAVSSGSGNRAGNRVGTVGGD